MMSAAPLGTLEEVVSVAVRILQEASKREVSEFMSDNEAVSQIFTIYYSASVA